MNKHISMGQDTEKCNQAYRVNKLIEIHLDSILVLVITVIDGSGSIQSHQTYRILFIIAQGIQCVLEIWCWDQTG